MRGTKRQRQRQRHTYTYTYLTPIVFTLHIRLASRIGRDGCSRCMLDVRPLFQRVVAVVAKRGCHGGIAIEFLPRLVDEMHVL